MKNFAAAAQALFASIVRTLVPGIVGAVLAFFVSRGISLDPEFEAALTLLLSLAFFGLYYILVRILETYGPRWFGWFLGLAKSPTVYTPESPVLIDPATTLEITDIAATAAYQAKHLSDEHQAYTETR